MLNPQKILVLAPHTDDGELGCGGTIAKLCNERKEVHYVAFSTCEKSLPAGMRADTLEQECKTAVKELGIDLGKLKFLNFEVRNFFQKRQEILEEMVSLNKSLQPDLVLFPSASDIHQDHQVIRSEALRAFKKSSMLGYELPWNQDQFTSTLFSILSKEQIEKKIKAIEMYKSQSQRNYTQEDFIRSLARVRGVQCNCEYAESFEVYKLIF